MGASVRLDAPSAGSVLARAKAFATLRAQLGLAGWTLQALEEGGSITFLASRWGRSRTLPDLDAVGAFARQVGAKS